MYCQPQWPRAPNLLPYVLLGDSTCRTNNAKGSKQIDYTGASDGFCDLFRKDHPEAFLIGMVYSGALISDLRAALNLLPDVEGITLVYMGNDYVRWDKRTLAEKAKVKNDLHACLRMVAEKSYDARAVLFGNDDYWKYGSEFANFVKEMVEFVGTLKQLPENLKIDYAEDLKDWNLPQTRGHFGASESRKAAELINSWVSPFLRRRPLAHAG